MIAALLFDIVTFDLTMVVLGLMSGSTRAVLCSQLPDDRRLLLETDTDLPLFRPFVDLLGDIEVLLFLPTHGDRERALRRGGSGPWLEPVLIAGNLRSSGDKLVRVPFKQLCAPLAWLILAAIVSQDGLCACN